MNKKNIIAVLDFGGQYAHLIANRIRRLGVYSEILPPASTTLEELNTYGGVVFSGGPSSVYSSNRPEFNTKLVNVSIPVLGICYGHQLLTSLSGGEVKPGTVKEYGKAIFIPNLNSPLFKNLEKEETVWMSHGDSVSKLADGFSVSGSTADCSLASVENISAKRFGLQFHPEVLHTKNGNVILSNFLDICGLAKTWDMDSYYQIIKTRMEEQVKDRNVFLLVSGGVDSTVAFALLNKIFGEKRVLGLHIDNGCMRKNESSSVMDFISKNGFNNLNIADASKEFIQELEGIADPEKKRRIIGDMFIKIQAKELDALGLDPDKWVIAQGTIYPDTIESGGTSNADLIKTHHNRVPVIQEMIKQGRLIEPLADLYKDEVRLFGEKLGIPEKLVWRHPFPGPGLGVRILCTDTALDSLSKEDSILEEQINAHLKEKNVSGRIIPIKSVGVQGDKRTYASCFSVETESSWQNLDNIATDITNRYSAINRVVYKISGKSKNASKRFLGYCTHDRLDILRDADDIVTTMLLESNNYKDVWQMPVVLLPMGSDSSKESIVLRPVDSTEAMTASFSRLDINFVKDMAKKILEIDSIDSVYYDITNKPPGTIEWE